MIKKKAASRIRLPSEMQILSGKLTAKQEFYQRNPVRQGFDKNLSPHTAYGRKSNRI